MEDSNKNNNNENQEIEVVNGNLEDLDVSPVYEHLNALKPKSKEEEKKQNIIIPEVKEDKKED